MTTKSKILYLLEKRKGESVSGQEIAESLGLSRAGVWKAIKTLQGEGYQISATPNKGYILDMQNDIVSEQGIRACLTKYKNIEIHYLETTTSTNAVAQNMVADGAPHGSLIVANQQTNGKGRIGRSFYSPSNGIYITVILRPKAIIQDALIITPAAAVAVVEAVKELANIDTKIKWVNDVFKDGKKVCGILTQASTDVENNLITSASVGIGINFVESQSDFPTELQSVATALFEQNPTTTRSALIAKIVEKLLDLTDNLNDHSFMNVYREKSFVIGRPVEYLINNALQSGIVIEIDDNCCLHIKEKDGIRVLNCGEISIRPSKN